MTQTLDTGTRTRAHPGLVAAFAVFLVGMVMRAEFAFWHPSLDALTYADLAPIRAQWWAQHVFVGAPGSVLTFAAFAVLAYQIGRKVLAAAGGVLATVGAVAFGLGIAGEGVTYGYVLDPAAVPAPQGAATVAYIADHGELSQLLIFGGQILTVLGVLVLLVAVWLARAVPRWLLALPLAGLALAQVLPLAPFTTGAVLLELVFQAAPLVAIAALAVHPKNVRP